MFGQSKVSRQTTGETRATHRLPLHCRDSDMSVGIPIMNVGGVDRLDLLTARIPETISSLSVRSAAQSLLAMVVKGSGMMSHVET